MKILAAIITHNRCELLERCINYLQKQTRLPDLILVVDNGSTDATVDMLMRRNIQHITQENLGSAGGWNRCISYALEHHYDAVWLMDDDGFPNPSALERLESNLETGTTCVSSVVLREKDRERLVFPSPVLNDKQLPRIIIGRHRLKTINDVLSIYPSGLYPFAMFFNGALISCDAIKQVGNVDKDFFIAGEEVDYFYRLHAVGKVLTDMNAHHYHPNVYERTWSDLKIYYYTKNTIILNKRYFKIPTLQNIFFAVAATFYRIFLHNGWTGVISYLYRNNLKSLMISIQRGLNGPAAIDFLDKRILVLCPHPENYAPGQRLKYEQYFEFLRDNNYDIQVSSFMTESFQKIVYSKGNYLRKAIWTVVGYFRRFYDLLRMPFYDGVYVFLSVTPFGPTFFEFLTRMLNKNIIYDIDDMVFLKTKSVYNQPVSALKGKGKMIYMMKHSKHIITCTDVLDAYARRYNQNTTNISSTINTDIYLPNNRYNNSNQLVIGWSGSHSTSQYLYLLERVLKKISDAHSVKILVIGDASFNIDGVNVEALPWRESTEVDDLRRIDIGLYPLPDEPWVYGKSGLKALQYMALGIPTVASAVGMNFKVIEDGVSGFLVKDDHEWITIIERLIDDPDLRARVGEASRLRVLNTYSVKVNQPIYLSIFKEVYR
jgi:GT2 family glycosyltransferase